MSDKVTARPWKWCGDDLESENGTDWAMEPEVSCGTWCQGGMVELNMSDADRAHIVKCVNYHERLVEALGMALEWIDAVPSETQLPAMPGFDRDIVNDLLVKIDQQ